MRLRESDAGVRESDVGVKGPHVRGSNAGVMGQTTTAQRVENRGGLAVVQDEVVPIHYPKLQMRMCT